MIPSLKFPVVLQQSSSDCGVACLASVIAHFGGEESLERLRELSGTAIQGTTVLGLMEAAKVLGLEANGYKVDGLTRLDELEVPAILHVIMDQKYSHYVVCHGKDASGYHLMDPAVGKRIYSENELDGIWKSRALMISKPTANFQTKSEHAKNKKKWILDLVRPDLPILLISGFLGLIVTILGLSVAVFSQKLIDELLPNEDWDKLVLGLVLLTILLLGRSLLSFLRATVLIRQSKDLNLRLISEFFKHLMYLPKRFFDSRKVGDITSRMNDSRRIQRAISILTTELMVDSFVVVVTLVAIFAYSTPIGWLVFGFLPIYFFLVYRYHLPIKKGQKQMMIRYSGSEATFIDTLSGVGAIKGAAREQDFLKRNLGTYGGFQQEVFMLGEVSNRLGLVTQLAGTVFLVSVLATSCYLVAKGGMDLGVLVAISGMLGMLVPAVNKLALANLQIQEAKIALDRLYEFVQTKGEEDNATDLVLEELVSLQVKKVSFRFPGRKLLLKELSFELRKGKLTVMLGESGGGKSTLLQILMGFYPIDQGEILINGLESIDQVAQKDWRKSIGYVPQEIKLFNGTLLYNLTLEEDPANAKAVMEFYKEIGLNGFFESLPLGIFTLVGEEGINLSGGQRQLVGLVRALLQKPKALLLDEFTGAMDRNTEQKMLDLILRIKEQMPVLVVTHRVKPALIADEVLILENGQLVDFGTPAALLEKPNLLSESVNDVLSWR
jgi:ABC-type bacteriocin/lantibiotic exporter with double-glycine peptidase domain